MDVAAYLERIAISGPVDHTIETLERLQRSHLTAVPFENLDVFHRRGVSTLPRVTVPKIVSQGRGGWCYEINGAFATLLDELGFAVRWIGAGVLPITGPMPDHLAVEVTIGRPYLVDVGFGDSFIRPLPLDDPGPHDGGTGRFWFEEHDGVTTLWTDSDEGPEPQYEFDLSRDYAAEDFEPSSHRLQTEPGLKWTERPFATRLLDGGPDRVTLLRDRIKFRRNGTTTEEPIPSSSEWNAALAEWFGMTP